MHCINRQTLVVVSFVWTIVLRDFNETFISVYLANKILKIYITWLWLFKTWKTLRGVYKAAFHWSDRSGGSCWSAQWNGKFLQIASTGTSKNVNPNWSYMADALATYWWGVSIQITADVLSCVANMTPFYRNQLHSYNFLFSFQSTDIPHWVQSTWLFFIFHGQGSKLTYVR